MPGSSNPVEECPDVRRRTLNQATKPTRAARKKPGPKPKVDNGDVAAAPAAAKLPYKFELKSTVTITASKEVGQVRARAEWATGNVSYYVAYTSKTGEYREAWIDQDLLTGLVERRKRGA
jgi:hypothetical protein